MTMNRVEVITSVERRRRWSAAEKARLVAAMVKPGAVVTEVARSAGVDASLLYPWRRELGARARRPWVVKINRPPLSGVLTDGSQHTAFRSRLRRV
jgi:transposase